MRSAGCSGTPLPRKLRLAPGRRIYVVDSPDNLAALLAGTPDALEWLARLAPFDVALVFVRERNALRREFARVSAKMPDAGTVSIAWPKKTSGVATDLDEDVARDVGLDVGLVDTKVGAIDATRSGLKFLRPLRDREKRARG